MIRGIRIGRRRFLGGLSWAILGTTTAGAQATQGPRVVTLEWASAESLMALGITPIAMASPLRSQKSPLRLFSTDHGVSSQSSVELGSMFEPNLELLALLKPDRIFAAPWHAPLLHMLRRIADTDIINIAEEPHGQYENSCELLIKLGRQFGRSAEAQTYIKDSAMEISRIRARLHSVAGTPTFIGTLDASGRIFNTWGAGSLFHDVLELVGLRNAYSGPTSSTRSARISIDRLAENSDAQLIYIDQEELTALALHRLESTGLWQNLPFVRSGRMLSIPYLYHFSGLPTARSFARSLAAAESKMSPGHG